MEIKGHEIEFFEDEHIYLCDGIVMPSITQILAWKFDRKYDGVNETTLKRAADKGTRVHKAIEYYEQCNEDSELVELRNYKFLKKYYKFECIGNEVTVILFDENNLPIACGRLDLVLREGEQVGLGDIKRTAVLDREYLTYQLNLYRIAYQQCYGAKIEFLRGIHLREDTRKYVKLPINEEAVKDLIKAYMEEQNGKS